MDLLHFICFVLIGVISAEIPSSVHIAFTGKPTEMSVMWITLNEKANYTVQYGLKSKTYIHKQGGTFHKYSSSNDYSAIVHEAILKNLPLKSKIYYRVGKGDEWTEEFSFETMFKGEYGFKFLTFGDWDTNENSYETLNNLLEKRGHQFIIHQGDLPYAWTEQKWDQWGRMVEPITANFPYMVSPGNHESGNNFTSYKNRFSKSTGVNSKSNSNLFYSWNYSWVHFISLSTEHSFEKDSEQINWLKNDLKHVNRTETPFIIVYQHRPMYSSNKNHGSFLKYRQIVEPLLKNVDLLLFGHVHAFERTCPIFDSKCVGRFTKHYFNNPKSPIHLCIGTAGFEMNRDWEDEPNWSLFRESSHGFAILSKSCFKT
eukprot:gene1243-11332_t